MADQMEVTGDNTPDVVQSFVENSPDPKRSAVLRDIEQTLGVVPGFFKMMPATHLEAEWKVFKEFELSDHTSLEPKTKELIGLAVAGALMCPYCTYFHTVAAALNGATPGEIEEAGLMAKHTAGWSTFLHSARYDMQTLKDEMAQIKRHMQSQRGGARH